MPDTTAAQANSGPPADPLDADRSQSTAQQRSPRLSARGLTWTLIVLTLIPTCTVLAIWKFLPQVYEGKLQATVTAIGLPPADFYKVRYDLRPPYVGGELVVQNDSDQDWSHLNIQVNGFYQIHDIEPIPAGEAKHNKLEKFLTRSGARFKLQYNQIASARIYARLPDGDRATFAREFELVPEE